MMRLCASIPLLLAATVCMGQSPATQPAPSPAAGSDAEAKAMFDSLEVAVGRGIWWWNRKLTISGDGTYTFELQTLEKVPGGDRIQQSRTPHVATYRISAVDMRELNQLLKATDWLGEKVPEGPGPCDAPEYAMTLLRGGARTVRRVFQGDAWAAYKSVLRFIMRIERQEELLYAVTNIGKPSPTAANDLGNEIEAVTSGAANRIVPYAPVLDYHRLVPAYCEYLANPKASASLAITAAKLAGMVKLETRRKDLEALANGRAASDPAYKVPVEVRGAAVAALARMGAAASLDALESAARAEKYCLAGDVAEALLTAPPDKAIRILTELASRAQNAAWALIRLGKQAEPAIVELLGKGGGDFAGGDHGGGRAAYLLVRAYHDHWKELPAAPGDRVMTAVREIIEIGGDASMAVEYGRKLLALAQKPYEPPTARMALEKYFALMTRPELSDHEKRLAAGQFVPNKPPEGFLDNVHKGKLKVGDIYTLKQDGWAHMVSDDGKTHYTVLLFDTRRTWWIAAAFKLSAEGVRADKDRFLARHPGAKLEQAKTTAPVGRNGPNTPSRLMLVSNTGDLPCADSF